MSSVRLELENIGVFRGRKEFSLSKGLNILYAPNASGKTSFVAGLKAVTISALSSEELSRVLNDYEERGYVKLVVDGSEYVVELVRKPGGKVEAWGKRLAENGVIRKVAFIDLENDLVNAIYAGDSERVKSVLREVSGVTHIETILKVLESLRSEHEYVYEKKKKEYESRKEEITEQRKRIEERLSKIRARISEILRDPRIEPARKEIEELESQRKHIQDEQSKLRKDEIEINNSIGLLEHDYTMKKAELDTLREQRDKISSELEDLEKKIIDVRKKIEALSSEVDQLKNRKTNLLGEIREKEDLLKRRKYVFDYAICPYCGAPVDKDKIMKEITEIESSIATLRKEVENIERTINEKEAEINELKESGEKRLSVLKEERERLDSRIKELEKHISEIEGKLQEEKKKLEEVRKQLRLYEEQLAIIDKKLAVLGERVKPVKELRELQKEEQKLLEDLDYVIGRLRQLDQLYAEVKMLEDVLSKIELLTKYFQIRLNELKHVVVEKINESVLKHFKLLQLAELEYPVLAEDFTLTLTRSGGTPTSLAELSDAEKAIFVILMTLALRDYVATDFPFYVVDTLIEFIDDTRAREILKYLMDIAGNDKVVIVTKTKPYTGEPKLLSQDDIIVNKIPI